METNTEYLIQKLREFNLPMPRNMINDLELEEINRELDQIEESIRIYREHLERATKIYRN